MLFHWILRRRQTKLRRSYERYYDVVVVVTNHQLDLPVDLETCVRLWVLATMKTRS